MNHERNIWNCIRNLHKIARWKRFKKGQQYIPIILPQTLLIILYLKEFWVKMSNSASNLNLRTSGIFSEFQEIWNHRFRLRYVNKILFKLDSSSETVFNSNTLFLVESFHQLFFFFSCCYFFRFFLSKKRLKNKIKYWFEKKNNIKYFDVTPPGRGWLTT